VRRTLNQLRIAVERNHARELTARDAQYPAAEPAVDLDNAQGDESTSSVSMSTW
jgi:hypothetical protein